MLGYFETSSFVYSFTFQKYNISVAFQICSKLKVNLIPAHTDPTVMKTCVSQTTLSKGTVFLDK